MKPGQRRKGEGTKSGPAQPLDDAFPGTTRTKPRRPAGAPVALALAIAFIGAGPSAGMLAYRLVTDAVIAAACFAAAAGLGWTVARRLSAPRLLRWVTATALGLGAMSLILLGLGLAGWLNALTAWGLLGAGWGLGALWLLDHVRHRPARNSAHSPAAPASSCWQWLWWLAMPALGLALLGAVVPPGLLWQDEPAGYDVSEYHLQVPREWYDAGRITPLQHNVFSYMPMNVEVHDLLAMHLRGGPWAGMYVAQFLHVGWMILAVLAAAAVASALAHDAPWAAPLAAAAMSAVPWVTLLAPIAYNEAGLMLFGTLAIGWALLAGDWRGWVVAGAAAGFACGVKLTAAPMVVLAVLVAALVIHSKSARQTPTELGPRVEPPLKGLAIFLLASLATFSPWLIRNQAWAHNPVFPERMETLGKAHFSDVQVERWRRAHSPTEAERPVHQRLLAAATRIVLDWRYGFLLLPLGVAALVVRRDRPAAFLGLLLLIQLLIWLGLTHLQGRFYVLAIPLAAVAIGSVRRPRWAFVATSCIVLTAIISLSIQMPQYTNPDKGLVARLANGGILGATDLRGIVAFDLDQVPLDKPLVLVGDAQAFFYSGIPMSRLHYRTVFDVPPAQDGDWLTAWTAGQPGTTLVFPGELRRFKRTYFEVPTPPREELDRRAAPHILQ